MWRGVIEEYRAHLPITGGTPVVTLLEGGTPLTPARFAESSHKKVWLKCEGLNPTGSFKDRGMTVAVSKAVEADSRGMICASTGNTAASASAYAARAGLPCAVIIPADGVALGKLVQVAAYSAKIIPVTAGFDAALDLARSAAERFGLTLLNSVNPHRLAGQKTAAFEICDVLGRAPEAIIIPVGNAGNITAYWQGFNDYYAAGRITTRPRLIGVQAEGSAPLVHGRPVENPKTVASAIRIGRPASWDDAVRAVKDSGGEFLTVTDEEILAAQSLLGREGLFVEPASAASVAGLLKLERENRATDDVVCVLTGHGLKDPAAIQNRMSLPASVPPTLEGIRPLLTFS